MGAKLLSRIGNWSDFAIRVFSAVLLALMIIFLWEINLDAKGPRYVALRNARVAVTVGGLALAGLLVAGGVVRLAQAVLRSTEGRYLVFDTPSGPVSFRAASVEQAINRTVSAMDEIADARLELVMPKHAKVPSEARLRCRLFDRPNLLAIQDQVRATVSDRYLEMFPGQEPLPVRISVERIVFETPGPKAVPPADAPSGEASAEAVPFRPQYPVGD